MKPVRTATVLEPALEEPIDARRLIGYMRTAAASRGP